MPQSRKTQVNLIDTPILKFKIKETEHTHHFLLVD
jgi:hypothetical protein